LACEDQRKIEVLEVGLEREKAEAKPKGDGIGSSTHDRGGGF
jgi:hypothetical protein